MADFTPLFGHIYDQRVQEELHEDLPRFGDVSGAIKDTGKGQVRLLYQVVRDILGSDFAEIQTIGDCVPHAYQRAWVMAACILAKTLNMTTIDGVPATEFWYALARVEIGKGIFNSGDGASGSQLCAAMKKYGTLFRKKYGNIDLTTYSGARARQWGDKRNGCPDELETLGKDFTVDSTMPAMNYEQGRDLLYNGSPIPVCSNWGFESGRRDSKGFIKPSGSWSHCMLIVAFDDRPERPGALIDNRSWPTSSVSGPKGEFDIPDGTWWVDAEYVDQMLAGKWGRQTYPDSYAVSGLNVTQNNTQLLVDMF
jgi:hypothetical protein